VQAHGGDSVIQRPALLARLGEHDRALGLTGRLFARKASFREYPGVIPDSSRATTIRASGANAHDRIAMRSEGAGRRRGGA
jgi:hypothetical protein